MIEMNGHSEMGELVVREMKRLRELEKLKKLK